jgi:hypothetical protein
VSPSPSPDAGPPSPVAPTPGTAGSRSVDAHEWSVVDDAFGEVDDWYIEDIVGAFDGSVLVTGSGYTSGIGYIGHFWRSADAGATWHHSTVVGSELIDVASGPSGYVAGMFPESAGEILAWWSNDAMDWHEASMPDPVVSTNGPWIGGVASGPYGYLAVGHADRRHVAWFSADGREWDRVGPELGRGISLDDVVALSDGRFVIVGVDRDPRVFDAVAWTVSGDGREWTPALRNHAIAGPEDEGMFRAWADERGVIAYGGAGDPQPRLDCYESAIAVVGETARSCSPFPGPGILFRSTDGRRWERLGDNLPEAFTDGPLRLSWPQDIRPWGDGYLAVGTGTDELERLWESADGSRWRPADEPLPGNSYGGLLVTDDRLFVAVDRGDAGPALLVGTPRD